MAIQWGNLREYWEGSAPRPQRRPSRGRSRNWLAMSLALVVLVALVGAARVVTRVVLENPYFFLSSVELHGARYAAPSEVEDQFVLDRGRSLLRVPLEDRRRAIERIPWVRSAAVTRIFPDRIEVVIEERIPVAFLWTDAGAALLDGAGVVLDLPPDARFELPVVQGVSADQSPEERRARMELFRELMSDLDRGEGNLRDEISEVDLNNPQDARVIVADDSGAVLLHLGREDFLQRYLLYASQIDQWQQKFANVRSVDLRFEGQVVINSDAQLPARSSGAASP